MVRIGCTPNCPTPIFVVRRNEIRIRRGQYLCFRQTPDFRTCSSRHGEDAVRNLVRTCPILCLAGIGAFGYRLRTLVIRLDLDDSPNPINCDSCRDAGRRDSRGVPLYGPGSQPEWVDVDVRRSTACSRAEGFRCRRATGQRVREPAERAVVDDHFAAAERRSSVGGAGVARGPDL